MDSLKLIFWINLTLTLHNIWAIAPKGHPRELKTKSIEKNLIRMLLNRYEQFGVIGRPVKDSKIKVDVKYGLQLFQILDLDENKQILRTNCWSMYKWTDSLLRWNESEYGNITVVRIFPSQIWTPDIKLYNFADERLREHREARVVVSSNGETLWVPQALFKSTCEVEITYFPFDTQICMLEFGSWTYDKTQMDILWWIASREPYTDMQYVDFSDYVPSNEWRTDGEKERNIHPQNRTIQIRSVKKFRRHVQTIAGEVVTREYPVLRYLIRLRRNPSFYVFMLVIPCVLLSSLTLVVFWLPPESPAKMMLGMNIFVAFFVLLLLLAESTPSAVKNFPLIGVYFCLNMIMITLSTFLATLVIHLYFRGDRNGAVPPVLRRIIIEGIGRLTLVRQKIPLPEVKKLPEVLPKSTKNKSYKTAHNLDTSRNKFINETAYSTDQNNVFGYMQSGNSIYNDKCAGSDNWYGDNDYRTASMFHDNVQLDHNLQPVYGLESNKNIKMDKVKDNLQPGDLPPVLSSSTTLEYDVRELKKYVKTLVNRQKDTARKSLVAMEWRTLAIVLDRLFFFIYITTIAIAVVVYVPRSTEPEVPEAFRDTY